MFSLLRELESSFNVKSIEVNSIEAWSIFRFRVFELIRTKHLNIPNRVRKLNPRIIIKLIFLLFYGLKYYLFPQKYEYLIFSSSERRKDIGGQKHDRVIEGLLSNSNSLLIENPFPSLTHEKKSKVPNKRVISESVFFFLVKILSFNEKYAFQGIDIIKEIEGKYSINLSIKDTIKRYLGQKKVAKILVRKFKPKAVFFVYGSSSQGYIEEFKHQSVSVVELQHGVINENHAAYNFPLRLNKDQLPDYLLTYGEYENQFFTEKNNFIDLKNVFPIGNYLIDYYRKVKKRDGEKKRLVFSGQSIFDHYSIPILNQVADRLPEFEIIFVPRDSSIRSNETLRKNIIVEKDKSVYEVLLRSSIHCTVNSSCAIDALTLGVPTVFIDFENQATSYFGGLSKYFHFVENVESLIEFLANFTRVPVDDIIEESYFFVNKNYDNNIKKFLEKL